MSEQQPDSLFRKQALEHISASQPLYNYIQISFPLAWGLLILIWLVLLAITLWLLLGQVGEFVEGRGILIQEQQIIAFVPAPQAAAIHMGMPANISSMDLQPLVQKYKGKVTAVDYVPVSPQNLLKILNNQSLVDYFLKNGPVVAVEIHLIPAEKNKPKLSLKPGMLIRTYIEIRHKKPIYLLMSISSKKKH